MSRESDEAGAADGVLAATEEAAARNAVARVRRSTFMGADGSFPAQPTAPIVRSVRYVEMHFDQEISLDDMAAAARQSRFHFSRKFKDETGLAPVAFLRGYRVVQAMTRLVDSDEQINRIARATGYQSAAAFTRAFRKATGSTPYLFRMTRFARSEVPRLQIA